MTVIYSATIKDATAELLRTWLHRTFWAQPTFMIKETGGSSPKTGTRRRIGIGNWEGILTEVHLEFQSQWWITELPPYRPPADDEPNDGPDGQRLTKLKTVAYCSAQQFFAAEVEIMFWEDIPGLFVDELRKWLIRPYGCVVTSSTMNDKDEEKLKSVMALIELRSKKENRRIPVKTLAELHADELRGTYDTVNRYRKYLNDTYNLNLEW